MALYTYVHQWLSNFILNSTAGIVFQALIQSPFLLPGQNPRREHGLPLLWHVEDDVRLAHGGHGPPLHQLPAPGRCKVLVSGKFKILIVTSHFTISSVYQLILFIAQNLAFLCFFYLLECKSSKNLGKNKLKSYLGSLNVKL